MRTAYERAPTFGSGSPGAAQALFGSAGRDVESRMEKLRYSVKINAPARDVWTTMLDNASYREWTSVFHSGSYYEGGWDKGGEIRFLGPDDDGKPGGMIATVEENRPHEFLSLRYTGQVIDGADDTTSDAAKSFIGAHENYAFREADGATTVEVELDSEDEFVAEFNAAWPLALERLKEITESRS
jgi:hypothetical protein